MVRHHREPVTRTKSKRVATGSRALWEPVARVEMKNAPSLRRGIFHFLEQAVLLFYKVLRLYCLRAVADNIYATGKLGYIFG
jgi:hypothetical protein